MTLYAIVLGPDLPEEVTGGVGLIAVGGAVWVLISGMMLGVLDDSGMSMMNVIFTFFAAPAAFSVAIARRYRTKRTSVEQVLRFLVPIVFLVLSESIMFAAAHSEEMGWVPVLIGVVTALTAFAYFIHRLIQ